MSAVPLRSPGLRAAPSWRPRLQLVRAPAPGRSRVPFLLLCLTILGFAMLGALALNTLMAVTSYEIADRQVELASLTQTEQQLRTEAESLTSPSRLAERAEGLGMVPAQGLTYINLDDGTITGPAIDPEASGNG